jgi:hypothetical protein
LRVKNTAYFDIAATLHQRTLGSLRRPLVGGYAPRTRPTSEPSLVLAAKIRVRRESTAPGHETGSASGSSAWAGGRLKANPHMGSQQEGRRSSSTSSKGKGLQAANLRSLQADQNTE